ncbi:hypothetical protein E2C01_082606 [Portunus trituberculatus]|uniref:Uncharacterized protein n=1 Tax=Portunus trituberculatus TaxID=210409 RepID=A0A5B7IZQ7_PORTR|nr:hypothetical protein [Portunus trituberculatus]
MVPLVTRILECPPLPPPPPSPARQPSPKRKEGRIER